MGCQHLAAHVAIFASINRHQPGGEIGQTRFVCPGRGRTGSSPARAAKYKCYGTPVIFLDFDGVLNTEQYQARLAIEGKPKKDAWGPLFDPRAVANLQKIVEATDSRIVISSSWRYIHKLGSLRMMWEVRGLPCGIHDVIPHEATYISRGEDIDWYLEKHGRLNYVIIDDVDDFFVSKHDHYVETNPIVGITNADAEKAIEILTK